DVLDKAGKTIHDNDAAHPNRMARSKRERDGGRREPGDEDRAFDIGCVHDRDRLSDLVLEARDATGRKWICMAGPKAVIGDKTHDLLYAFRPRRRQWMITPNQTRSVGHLDDIRTEPAHFEGHTRIAHKRPLSTRHLDRRVPFASCASHATAK